MIHCILEFLAYVQVKCMPTTKEKLEWKKWNYITIQFLCYMLSGKIHLKVDYDKPLK